MSKPASPLPDFSAPPLNEVVLGIQSDKLAITTPYLGLFWQRIRSEYPTVEVQPALEPQHERFDEGLQAPMAGFRLLDKPETPRCWFIDSSGNRVIQLQQDRLLVNWRRRDVQDVYPRYPDVRARFAAAAEQLGVFVQENALGDLAPPRLH